MAAVVRGVWIKPLRRAPLWLSLWALAILAVIAVCLMPPPPLPPLPEHSDKFEHLISYFLLSAAAVQLFARGRPLWFAAGGLVALGIGIEFAQGLLTTDRSADPFDALANGMGVLLGMTTAFMPWRDLLLRLDRR